MNLLMGTVMLSLAFASGYDQTTNASAPRPSGEPPRVRTADATLAVVIAHALEASPTFRRLVEAIQTTDGIVYVEQGRCSAPVGGCTGFGAGSGPNRILHVRIHLGRRGVDAGTIGHELQHALEVLGSPSVRSAESMVMLYMRIGEATLMNGRLRETSAAVAAGNAVRSELRAVTRAADRQRSRTGPAGVTNVTASK